MPSGLGKALTATVPAPALLIFGKWTLPFAQTFLVYPEGQTSGSIAGGLLGLVLAVPLRAVMAERSPRAKTIGTIISLVITLALLGACAYFWDAARPSLPRTPDESEHLKNLWFFSFVGAMGFFCLTITFTSLVYPETYKFIIWVIIGLAVLLVVATLVFHYWLHLI
jgi:hypothetical protein